MRSSIICAVIVGSLLLLLCNSLHWRVDPLSGSFKDEYSRYRVVHGVNSVYKQSPHYPSRGQFNTKDSLVAEDFQNLKSWGLNSIRLYIAWEGFEPERDQYNYTYLQQLRGIVREAEQYGINILIDAHQDLFSRKFCGEGFPDWVVKVDSFPSPWKVKLEYDSKGYPTKKSCMQMEFVKYYLSHDVMRFSNEFFTNKNGMLDEFIEFWRKVTAFFLPEHNVIGYDLINEPTGANAYVSPFNYIGPGINSNRYLLPFYKKVSKVIREIDQEKFMFFEPLPVDYFGAFYQAPSDPEYQHLDVISFHNYCPLKIGSSECKLFNTFDIDKRVKNMKKLRIGGALTEFGSLYQSDNQLKELKENLDAVESHQVSWYYWQFKYNADSTSTTNPPELQSFYNPDGSLQQKKVKTLSHPYAYAICGEDIVEAYEDNFYSLQLDVKQCNGEYTEIYLNENFYFPKGFEVSFSPSCSTCRISTISKNYYKVIVSKDLIGKRVKVVIAGYM